MLDAKVKNFIYSLRMITDYEEKVLAGLKGFFDFFPFSRLSLFSYSPLNYIGEGVIFLDSKGTFFSKEQIREDVRDIPPIYSAIRNKRPEYVVCEDCKRSFPSEYVKKYELSSLLVVPVTSGSMVIGCVLIDRYYGSAPISSILIETIDEYFKLACETIVSFPAMDSKKLSKREIEVLLQLSHGWSTKEMAELMGISEFTARDYISSAMGKLGVRHRAQAVAEAIRTGLIS